MEDHKLEYEDPESNHLDSLIQRKIDIRGVIGQREDLSMPFAPARLGLNTFVAQSVDSIHRAINTIVP